MESLYYCNNDSNNNNNNNDNDNYNNDNNNDNDDNDNNDNNYDNNDNNKNNNALTLISYFVYPLPNSNLYMWDYHNLTLISICGITLT